MVKLVQNLSKKGWLQLLLKKTNTLNKKRDPIVPRIKHSNLERKKKLFKGQLLLGSPQFFIAYYFVKVFFVYLFQILSVDRLREFSCELSLLKVQIRADALSEVILIYSFTNILNKVNLINVWLQIHIHLIFHKSCSIFPTIYDCSKQKLCKLGMNMGMMKLFSFFIDILPSTSFRGRCVWNSFFFDSLFCSKYFIIK